MFRVLPFTAIMHPYAITTPRFLLNHSIQPKRRGTKILKNSCFLLYIDKDFFFMSSDQILYGKLLYFTQKKDEKKDSWKLCFWFLLNINKDCSFMRFDWKLLFENSRLVVKMCATVTKNAGRTVESLVVKHPAHPTYDLKGVIQLKMLGI